MDNIEILRILTEAKNIYIRTKYINIEEAIERSIKLLKYKSISSKEIIEKISEEVKNNISIDIIIYDAFINKEEDNNIITFNYFLFLYERKVIEEYKKSIKISNYDILLILHECKYRIIKNECTGICSNLIEILNKRNSCVNIIGLRNIIPELNPIHLCGKYYGLNELWWDITDRDSRIKAIEKIITIYQNKVDKEQKQNKSDNNIVLWIKKKLKINLKK